MLDGIHKHNQALITHEVSADVQRLEFTLGQHLSQMSETLRGDIVGGDVKIFQVFETFAASIVQLCKIDSSLILDNIAFVIETSQSAVLDSFAKGFNSLGSELVHLNVEPPDVFVRLKVAS